MYGHRSGRTALIFFLWISTLAIKVQGYFGDELNPTISNLEVWYQSSTRGILQNAGDRDLGCERPSVYICEEPLETIPVEATKACDFRNQLFHEQVFRWVAGRGCLQFTPDFLFVGGVNPLNLNRGCYYGELFAPCLEIAKDDGTCGCYPFDPGLEEVAVEVRNALIPAAHGRWERCFYAASHCCSHYMPEVTNVTNTEECRTTFDGWTCWHAAEAGTIATEVCSEFAYSGQGPTCHHFSSKECYPNASWEIQTDYTTCAINPRLLRRYRYHIGMLSFSIASCLPAVIIFFAYKRLRITRVTLHRNLLIAIIIRNVLVIVSRSEIYIHELSNSGDTVLTTHSVACRVLAVAERIAANAVFVCMLVEGVYLHRLIVAVFRKKLNINLLYAIGAVIAIVPVVAWSVVMGVYDDHSCWIVYTIDHVQWILDAPRMLILIVNTILFIDVLRVLLTKIRNTENANQLSTAKATIFLMPLFGTQFLLTAFRPSTTNCTGEQIYYYVAYTVEGLQGFLVAMLYCYANKEVHTLVKATYKSTEHAIVSRVRGDSEYPRMSFGPNSDRRMTYSTAVPANDDIKDQYATIRPKIHVAEIISIQASERLAEILEPVYESLDNGVVNNGYDPLDKSDIDNDSTTMSKPDDYVYGFTNASSVSIDCQDWIRCVSSPSSSVYDNSLNDFETKYLEHKFPSHPKIQEARDKKEQEQEPPIVPNYVHVADNKNQINVANASADAGEVYEDCETMLEEIINYMQGSDNQSDTVVLDPNALCPYNKGKDNIVFVDD